MAPAGIHKGKMSNYEVEASGVLARQPRKGGSPEALHLPLIVDLDGTLLNTDMLHESALVMMRDHPSDVWRLPGWLARGKAALKRGISERFRFDPALLPYNEPFVAWLRGERQAGRTLALCTASDAAIARPIAAHLGLFDDVIASDGVRNLSGEAKASALEARYGSKGYDYAGNSRKDLPVWGSARRAVVVNGSASLAAAAGERCDVERTFPAPGMSLTIWRRLLRSHQWMKNLLLFVPLLAAQQLTDAASWRSVVLAFVAFSLCASSVYIANDLLDLESDRRHPRKRQRPFASGRVPIVTGVMLAPLLVLASFAIATLVDGAFLPWLVAYFVVTCAYSWSLKRMVVVDCLTLAMLYTLRVVAGAAAAVMPLSFWLLAFSVFLFLSLAFVKRYAELEIQVLDAKVKVHGRGYYTTDAPLVQALGVASGYAAVLVLALYLNSDTVVRLYRFPEAVWGTVPLMVFWISWMWMQAHRGNMNDDPLVFAVRDRASLVTGALFVLVLVIGATGAPLSWK